MNFNEYEEIVKKDKKLLKELKLSKEQENEINKMFDELSFHYNRIKRYNELNTKVYEEEHEILIQNFIKMCDANEELTNQSIFKTMYRKIRSFGGKVLRKLRLK